jgi:hypothetical protein
MEKKVLTEILRIKELIGGESLLTEQVSFVKALKSLQKIFSYESDDVIKKIINSDDKFVQKLKNGDVSVDAQANYIVKNAGGVENLYKNLAKETFNQKNYKEYYIDFQNLKKIGTMDNLQSYNDMIDQSIPKLLPNANEEFRTVMKNMLKDELQTYIENKTKTNPFLQDVPNTKKIKEPISSGVESSVFDNIDNFAEMSDEAFNKKYDEWLTKTFKELNIKNNVPIENQKIFNQAIISKINAVGEEMASKIPKETIDQMEFVIEELNKMRDPIKKRKLIDDTINKLFDSGLIDTPLTTKTKNNLKKFWSSQIQERLNNPFSFKKHYEEDLNADGKVIKRAISYWAWYKKTIAISASITLASTILDLKNSGLWNKGSDAGKKWAAGQFSAEAIGKFIIPNWGLLYSGGQLAISFLNSFIDAVKFIKNKASGNEEEELSTGEKVTLYAFKLLLQTSTMPKKYIENVEYDATTEKFMYNHPNGTIYEIFDVGKNANEAYIKNKKGDKKYLTQFK